MKFVVFFVTGRQINPYHLSLIQCRTVNRCVEKIVISGFFMLLGLIVLAQHTNSGTLQLAVRGGPQDRTLAFRPGKRIKLTTTTGEIIYSRQYLVYGNEILTENNILIGFDDLVRISGRVMNNTGRVAAGALLLTTGVILAGSTIAIATLALTPGSLLLYLAIEAGIIVGGQIPRTTLFFAP